MQSRLFFIVTVVMALGLVCSLFVGETMANKNKGEDIILYNGNIVLRGGKGKGKGGSIVVANSPSQSMDYMPMWAWGGMGRR